MFGISILISIGLVLFLTIFYGWEEHDKQKRRRESLPPKRYHDITDYEVIDVVVHKHDD